MLGGGARTAPHLSGSRRRPSSTIRLVSQELNETAETQNNWSTWVFASLALTVLAGAAVWYRAYLYSLPTGGLERAAWTGDAFAPFTAGITALALLIAAVSVHMQSKELRLQRQELRDARRELRLQREQQEKANAIAAQQQQQQRLTNEIEAKRLVASVLEAAVRLDENIVSVPGRAYPEIQSTLTLDLLRTRPSSTTRRDASAIYQEEYGVLSTSIKRLYRDALRLASEADQEENEAEED